MNKFSMMKMALVCVCVSCVIVPTRAAPNKYKRGRLFAILKHRLTVFNKALKNEKTARLQENYKLWKEIERLSKEVDDNKRQTAGPPSQGGQYSIQNATGDSNETKNQEKWLSRLEKVERNLRSHTLEFKDYKVMVDTMRQDWNDSSMHRGNARDKEGGENVTTETNVTSTHCGNRGNKKGGGNVTRETNVTSTHCGNAGNKKGGGNVTRETNENSTHRTKAAEVTTASITDVNRAIEEGDLATLKVLLHGQVNVQIVRNRHHKWSAITAASYHNQVAIVTWLLVQPLIDVNAVDSIESNALTYASKFGNSEIVKLLMIDPAIDINHKNNFGETALKLAICGGNTDVARLLLRHHSIDINAQDLDANNALMCASKRGDAGAVRLLVIRPNIDINARNQPNSRTALMMVCDAQSGAYLETIWVLSKQPTIDVNAADEDGITPLMLARDNIDIARILLRHPSINCNQADVEGFTALIYASKYNYTRTFHLLLQQSSIDVNSIDADGRTVLIHAIGTSNSDTVKQLLQHPSIDVNTIDVYNQTPFTVACSLKKLEVMRMIRNNHSFKGSGICY